MEIFQERQVLQFGLLPPHQSYLGLYHHSEILKYYHLDHKHPCFFRISLLSKRKTSVNRYETHLPSVHSFIRPSWTSTTKADWIERVSKLAYFRALSIVSGKCSAWQNLVIAMHFHQWIRSKRNSNDTNNVSLHQTCQKWSILLNLLENPLRNG